MPEAIIVHILCFGAHNVSSRWGLLREFEAYPDLHRLLPSTLVRTGRISAACRTQPSAGWVPSLEFPTDDPKQTESRNTAPRINICQQERAGHVGVYDF